MRVFAPRARLTMLFAALAAALVMPSPATGYPPEPTASRTIHCGAPETNRPPADEQTSRGRPPTAPTPYVASGNGKPASADPLSLRGLLCLWQEGLSRQAGALIP